MCTSQVRALRILESQTPRRKTKEGCRRMPKKERKMGRKKLINGLMPSHLPNQPHGKPGSARFNDNQPDSAAGKTLSPVHLDGIGRCGGGGGWLVAGRCECW